MNPDSFLMTLSSGNIGLPSLLLTVYLVSNTYLSFVDLWPLVFFLASLQFCSDDQSPLMHRGGTSEQVPTINSNRRTNTSVVWPPVKRSHNRTVVRHSCWHASLGVTPSDLGEGFPQICGRTIGWSNSAEEKNILFHKFCSLEQDLPLQKLM